MKQVEPAEREEGHIGDAGRAELVDHRIVAALDEIIVVLHATDGQHRAPVGDLLWRYVAEPDMADEASLLQIGQLLQLDVQ